MRPFHLFDVLFDQGLTARLGILSGLLVLDDFPELDEEVFVRCGAAVGTHSRSDDQVPEHLEISKVGLDCPSRCLTERHDVSDAREAGSLVPVAVAQHDEISVSD